MSTYGDYPPMVPRKQVTRGRHYDGEIIGGRPYLEAHIPIMNMPLSAEQIEDFREKYSRIIQELNYQEQGAWCRAFGYKRSTYLARKYQHRQPKLEEVILTLYWYENGKAVKYRKHKYRLPKGDTG